MNGKSIAGQPLTVLLLLTGVVGLLLSFAPPACAAASRECATAHVGAPFRLPDGLLYPAGALTLCDSRTYSPVDTLHSVLVDGSSVGLFVSRRRFAEAHAASSAEFVFRHGADGTLELVGYTMPRSGRSIAYRLKSLGLTTWQASAPRSLGGAAGAPLATIVATAGTH
jgi:hypothetical protein